MNDPQARANWNTTFNSASDWVTAATIGESALTGAAFAAPAVVAGATSAAGYATTASTTVMGWGATAAGWGYALRDYINNVAIKGGPGGFVIGRFPGYVQAAKDEGLSALNTAPRVYNALNNIGLWGNLNRAYINTQLLLNQRVYLSSGPLSQEGSWFDMELKHLVSKGVGPEQWRFVPYSQIY